jgi:hypothetical protein
MMKRNMKTLLMGTVALTAGVGLASAQGMRDVPSANDRGASSNSSDQMAPSKSGSHREMKGSAERGKSEKSEPRGQAQRGPSDKNMSKGQAKNERHERSTTVQGASDKDELKSKSAAKPAEKLITGQATKNRADTGKSAAKNKSEKSTTGQASKDKTERSTTGQGPSDTKASSGSKAPDTKASSDSKAQTPQNRQSQDPNAAKQNQTSGSATQSNAIESSASIRSQAGVQVSSRQRTMIQKNVLSAHNAPRIDQVNFSIHTGTVVPRHVHVVSVSTFPILIETFPRYRDYSFFVVEDEIVFVNHSHEIVDVIPVGGGGHFARSSTGTTVAVDLSEPEIREIQLVLIRRGYLHGDADGIWGPDTREALITFQRKEGFEASGHIDTRTVTALGLEGKVKVKSEAQSNSSSSTSSSHSSLTSGQGATQNGAQKPDEKSTTSQAASSSAQKNAAPAKGPSEQKGSNNAQPTQKGQRSAAPGKSTTGQGSSEKSTQPGMSDQKTSQPPAASEQNDKRRQ